MSNSSFHKQFTHTSVWYHGTTSTQITSLKKGIDVHYSKRNCDFGIGFYVTSRLNQTIKWAKRKTKDEIAFNPNVKPVVLVINFHIRKILHLKYLKLLIYILSLFIKTDYN